MAYLEMDAATGEFAERFWWCAPDKRSAVPTPKPRKAKALARSAWADYRPVSQRTKNFEFQHFIVTFKDGTVVKPTHCGRSDRPYNWGGAWRISQEFRKLRLKTMRLGKIERMVCNGVECSEVQDSRVRPWA